MQFGPQNNFGQVWPFTISFFPDNNVRFLNYRWIKEADDQAQVVFTLSSYMKHRTTDMPVAAIGLSINYFLYCFDEKS